MSEAGYWVNISRGGSQLGAGFLLVGCYVVTTYHCLARGVQEADDADVEVRLAHGEMLRGRVHRLSPAADLALIDVPGLSERGPVSPHPDRASAGQAWRNPYRPSIGHAFLSGMIDALPVSYLCEGGDAVEAMQLRCEQDLGDYSGYSGSPIEGKGPEGDTKLFGILIEQYPEHFPTSSGPRPASKVLFAVMLSEVARRFFHSDLLLDLLPSSSVDEAARPRRDDSKFLATDWARKDAQSRTAFVDVALRALDEWQKSGLVDALHITALKVQVIERYLLGGSTGGPS
jgi:hypothetical protein